MDPEIEELKELTKRNIELAQDTNRIVHSMRRAARWSRMFTIIWWVLVVGVSGAAYYLYLAPYMEQVQKLYSNVQSGATQFQQYEAQFASFLKQMGSKPQ